MPDDIVKHPNAYTAFKAFYLKNRCMFEKLHTF